MPSVCLGCAESRVSTLMDLGPQPPSNRYIGGDAEATDMHPLVVGQCSSCGLVQLTDPMPTAMVQSRFPWVTYSEPEGHLDELAALLIALPGLTTGARIVGLTYKDDTLLQRLDRRGFGNCYRYSAGEDLGLTDPTAGLESVQAVLDASVASALVAKHGTADLLLVRHVLEHAHAPDSFLSALRSLVRPGGHLVFEVPDCAKFLTACDYSFLWEEHITYFDASTFVSLAEKAGMAVHEIEAFAYPLEDSLVGISRNLPPERPAFKLEPVGSLLRNGQRFAEQYEKVRAQLLGLFEAWNRKGLRIAIFGAGHLAGKFVNLHSLDQYVDCVIDDDAKKQGLRMPGSCLPILGSNALENIDICLLALNAENEQRVRKRHGSFIDCGGRFYSIFALHPNAVHKASMD